MITYKDTNKGLRLSCVFRGCRYFLEGKGNPQLQRERDCSYTGQYR